MKSAKGCNIEDIKDGQKVEGLFMVRDVSLNETRSGKPYLNMTVMDKTGEIPCRIWDEAERRQSECPAGGLVFITADAQSYKGVLQLKVNEIEAREASKADILYFMPASPADISEMAASFLDLVKSVRDPFLRRLLLCFFPAAGRKTSRKAAEFFEHFKMAPAAKRMHHAYIGGLLEHTLAVARLADSVCRLYSALDRSMLLTGALLHDIGKVEEFSYESQPIDYTDRGRLVGHLVIGVEMIEEGLKAVPNFPEDLAFRLKHLVLSHHGRHEYGSPTVPMTMEAIVLNFLDDLDAKINYVQRLGGQVREPGYSWTAYQRPLDRFLYVSGPKKPEETDKPDPGGAPGKPLEKAKHEAGVIQKSLWEK